MDYVDKTPRERHYSSNGDKWTIDSLADGHLVNIVLHNIKHKLDIDNPLAVLYQLRPYIIEMHLRIYNDSDKERLFSFALNGYYKMYARVDGEKLENPYGDQPGSWEAKQTKVLGKLNG